MATTQSLPPAALCPLPLWQVGTVTPGSQSVHGHVPRDTAPCPVPAEGLGWEGVQVRLRTGSPAHWPTLTRIVVTTRVLLARVCDRLMSRVVAFMARVRLEYHTPICGQRGCHQHKAYSCFRTPRGPTPAGLWHQPGPAHLSVALAGLLQDAQCVVGPLPFAVELNPPSQPIILYLAGREAGRGRGGRVQR